MKDLETKQNVLKEIMALMDEREGDKLKSHPKLMAAKIEVEKPKGAEGILEKLKNESPEAPEAEAESEVTPEQLQKLLDHFKGLS